MIEALFASPFFIAGAVLIAIELRKTRHRTSGGLIGLVLASAGIFAALDSFYPIPTIIVYLISALYASLVLVSLWLFFRELARPPHPS